MKIRIGTRGSELALWQAHHVAGLIGTDKTEIVIIKTQGDKILDVSFDKMEGKNFFTKEIEEALLDNRVDIAVHSLKDLSTENVEGLVIAAIPEREDPRDTLLIRKESYDPSTPLKVKKGATIGTSSVRRVAQLKKIDPDLKVTPLRGNVNTRLNKIKNGQYDAIVMAYAGIKRINLDIEGLVLNVLSTDIFIPAPAQGALGIQIRSNDDTAREAVRSLGHPETSLRAIAERTFLARFGGGCQTPLGAIAYLDGDTINLTGIIASVDGTKYYSDTVQGKNPEELGAELALKLKQRGAEKLL